MQHWCDSPEYLCGFQTLYLREGQKALRVERARAHKGMVLLKLEGIDNMDQAVTLRGKILYIDRGDAPEDGAVFVQDLMGLEVRDEDSGVVYGKLTDVIFTGANDVYEVTGEDGKKRLVPAIPDVIIKRELEKGLLFIRPLEGLFDEN